MNAEQHQTAVDLWTKPTDLNHWPACTWLGSYIHHGYLLLLRQKADTQWHRQDLVREGTKLRENNDKAIGLYIPSG